jgi:hypothetical protein
MRVTILASAILCVAGSVYGQVAANLVIKEGDALGGSTVASLNAPFTNGLGQVGFVVPLADVTRAIWFNGGQIFNSADALPDLLTGGEGTMGVGDNGEFNYSPSFNDADSVWGQNGLRLVEDTQAPGFPTGINSTFHSRPQMTDDGTAYWVSGFNDGAGGTSSIGRMLYRQNPDTTFEVVITAGDIIDGLPVAVGSAVGFDYNSSGNNVHLIVEVNLDTGSTSDDGRQLVNGVVVAAEASPTGQGDNWDNFDISSINNSGNYVFSGDTDGDTAADEFIAYNAVIGLRQGDVVSAGTLDGSVDAVSINNLGQAAFIWDLDDAAGDIETLFFASDASNLVLAQPLASVGDTLDVNNDGMADWVLSDFNASAGIGPGIDFAENGLVYVEVDLESLDGSTSVEAIVSFAIPEPSSMGCLALGAVMFGTMLRRRRRP